MIVRLFAYADENWPFLTAHYYQIDLLGVPLTKFLDLVYAWLVSMTDPKKLEMFLADLEAPLPGSETKISDASAEAEGESFMAAMNTLQRG